MKSLTLLLAALGVAFRFCAAYQLCAAEFIPLWPDAAPGALGQAEHDIPAMSVYLPENATGPTAAVVIFPGGGYHGLAMGHEGEDYARFLNQNGIAGFVVRYRLGSKGYRHPVMGWDAARAVRTVRHEARKYNIDPDRVGVMGSSAGGHLAATVLTAFDAGDPEAADPVERFRSRPDFGILCYPVITMGPGTHAGSRNNLLGSDAPAELIDRLSAEKQVTAATPPCFLWHTADDSTVSVNNSLMFATALQENKVPFALHIYPHGRHGLGLGDREFPYRNALPWTQELVLWLKDQKLISL